jgi:hypothetical protein
MGLDTIPLTHCSIRASETNAPLIHHISLWFMHPLHIYGYLNLW